MKKVGGYKVVCHGAQTMYLKKKYCHHCEIYQNKKYPQEEESWRTIGYIHHGGKCKIRQKLEL